MCMFKYVYTHIYTYIHMYVALSSKVSFEGLWYELKRKNGTQKKKRCGCWVLSCALVDARVAVCCSAPSIWQSIPQCVAVSCSVLRLLHAELCTRNSLDLSMYGGREGQGLSNWVWERAEFVTRQEIGEKEEKNEIPWKGQVSGTLDAQKKMRFH